MQQNSTDDGDGVQNNVMESKKKTHLCWSKQTLTHGGCWRSARLLVAGRSWKLPSVSAAAIPETLSHLTAVAAQVELSSSSLPREHALRGSGGGAWSGVIFLSDVFRCVICQHRVSVEDMILRVVCEGSVTAVPR